MLNSLDLPILDAVPNIVWLICASCTFLAHTLDGTDGKQARRTGASGPTGELCIALSVVNVVSFVNFTSPRFA